MIQQSHLTAWQAHAPWPRRSQIEQDLRLSRGVAAIFADDVLRDCLAMRGGTVLHKAHLAPAARYSEDIDLVLVKALDTGELDQRLCRGEANAKLDQHLRSPAFRRDMDTLLRRDLGRFDVDEAAAVVRAAYFEHLEP